MSWAYTDSVHPTTSYVNPTDDVPLGAWADSAGVVHESRVYATFDLSSYNGEHLLAAHLYFKEEQATDCVDRDVQAWVTAASTKPTWAKPPAETMLLGTYGGAQLCPASVGIDLSAELARAQATHLTKVTIELKVPGAAESNVALGRLLSSQYRVRLSIGDNTVPAKPTELYNGFRLCDGSQQYLSTPTLRARVIDPDPQDTGQLTATFAVWPAAQPSQRTTLTSANLSTNWVTAVTVPLSSIVDGTRYAWQVQVSDGTDTSTWSKTCYFTADSTRPATPTVTSTNYLTSEWSPVGVPGHFTFSAAGSTDVIGYAYSWNNYPGVLVYSIGSYGVPIWTDPFGSTPGLVRAPSLGGPVAVDLSPTRSGPNTLYVASIDRAYNASTVTQYQVMIQDSEPTVTEVGTDNGPNNPITLKLSPNANVTGVASYTYQVNSNAKVTVPAAADGTATISVTPTYYGQFSVAVTSTSANGFVSTPDNFFLYISNEPKVSSDVYPAADANGDGGGGVGVPGTFAFAPGMPGVTTYYYSVDWGDTQTLTTGADGTASFTWTPDTAGYHQIEVYSIDATGNQSDYNFYDFVVNG
ncbi:hypothetical protein [Dactylosporangium sp. CA-092794]|uniref:hypothetical protein n=1 Tax=Dactylosporangium sp. CA-092794 TaxID=3239929 RepID=UPI003D8F81A7